MTRVTEFPRRTDDATARRARQGRDERGLRVDPELRAVVRAWRRARVELALVKLAEHRTA